MKYIYSQIVLTNRKIKTGKENKLGNGVSEGFNFCQGEQKKDSLRRRLSNRLKSDHVNIWEQYLTLREHVKYKSRSVPGVFMEHQGCYQGQSRMKRAMIVCMFRKVDGSLAKTLSKCNYLRNYFGITYSPKSKSSKHIKCL